MSERDEISAAQIRAALSEALRLPGEVRARPGAAGTIRARARARHRTTVVTVAVAVPACLGIAAILIGLSGSGPRSAGVPATQPTVTSRSPVASLPAAQVTVAPGPRRLGAPIEIRPVLREFASCPAHAQTVPAAVGPGCFRLGPAALVIRRVRDLNVGLSTLSNGTVGDRYELNLTMTAHDTATFSALTAASLHKQLAFVVEGKVQTAPSIEGHITVGEVQFPLDAVGGQAFVTQLTG
jgi:hypothetical protein